MTWSLPGLSIGQGGGKTGKKPVYPGNLFTFLKTLNRVAKKLTNFFASFNVLLEVLKYKYLVQVLPLFGKNRAILQWRKFFEN